MEQAFKSFFTVDEKEGELIPQQHYKTCFFSPTDQDTDDDAFRTLTPQRPIPRSCVGYGHYWIPKSILCNEKKLKSVLTIRTVNKYTMVRQPSFRVYKELPTMIGVPRFLGQRKWGPPAQDQTTTGAPMNPNITFNGSLRDTTKYPQKKAVRAWLKHNSCGLLSLFCGCGKTVVAIYAALCKQRRTMILVHETHLVEQWRERLRQFVPDAKVGIVVQNTSVIEGMDFVIGMIPSISKRPYEHMDTIGTLIIDEAHHIAARTFSQSVFRFNAKYVMALSATPSRTDGLTHLITWITGPIFFRAERQDTNPLYIEQVTYLNPKVATMPEIKNRLGKVILPLMIRRLIFDAQRNKLILTLVEKLFAQPSVERVMVVSERRTHLESLFEVFQKHNYDCGLYMGGIKMETLEEAKSKQLICASYAMASEALDIKGLQGMVLCTPWGRTQQVIGRLREDKNSTQRFIYDIVDPYSIFEKMAWKRYRIYKRLNCRVVRKNNPDV